MGKFAILFESSTSYHQEGLNHVRAVDNKSKRQDNSGDHGTHHIHDVPSEKIGELKKTLEKHGFKNDPKDHDERFSHGYHKGATSIRVMHDSDAAVVGNGHHQVDVMTDHGTKNESVVRESKGMPLKGHPYHSKSDDELRYIQKDAGEAARAMKDHSPQSENKYLDQVNDASTVLHYRKNGGKQVKTNNEVTAHGPFSPYKTTFTAHITRKGSNKPESYDFESYSPRKIKAHHAEEGDTIHKIVVKGSGEDVTNESSDQVEEGLRKIGQHENGNKKATVHKDTEYAEYRVKFHTDGKHHTEADYHTDDKEDAHDTAKAFINRKDESTELTEAAGHERLKQHKEVVKTIAHHADKPAHEFTPLKSFGHHEHHFHVSDDKKKDLHHDLAKQGYAHKAHHDAKGEHSADYYSKNRTTVEVRHYHNVLNPEHNVSVVTNTHSPKSESTETVSEDRETRNEFDANNDLADTKHHVYVNTRGKKKSIAGPFRSKEEAEGHPARKFGDGVATSDQISAS